MWWWLRFWNYIHRRQDRSGVRAYCPALWRHWYHSKCLSQRHSPRRVNNMHRVWEFPVHGIIKEGDNTLTVKITSPNRYIKEMDEKTSPLGRWLHHDRLYTYKKSPLYVRLGLGPMLPDMGIWRSVSLIVPVAGRILDVYYSQKHTDNKVTLKALLHIENHGCKKAMVEISDPQQYRRKSRHKPGGKCRILWNRACDKRPSALVGERLWRTATL